MSEAQVFPPQWEQSSEPAAPLPPMPSRAKGILIITAVALLVIGTLTASGVYMLHYRMNPIASWSAIGAAALLTILYLGGMLYIHFHLPPPNEIVALPSQDAISQLPDATIDQ